MDFKTWVVDLFKDERGHTSIKPVIAFIGCIFLCTTMLMNGVLSKGLNVNDSLVDAVMIITAIGMGADTLDKFSYKRRYEDTPIHNDPIGGDIPPQDVPQQ